MEWFDETLHAGWRQGIRIEKVLFRDRTEHQDLVIFESLDLGTGAGAGRRGADHHRR